MSDRVLFVDDDPNVLAAMSRQLHRVFKIETALGGPAGLDAVRNNGPYSVVVADMRMPEVDGVALLMEVYSLSPMTVRIMLTGNSDQRTAMEAVNQGAIFRFLTKPCPSEVLAEAITDAITQYRMVVAEAELLERTLIGAVRVLTEILAGSDPDAFGRSVKLRQLASNMATKLGVPEQWQVEMAAMLASIGCVAVPPDVRRRAASGAPLTDEERLAMVQAPQRGANLLRNIPRLEPVANIVLYTGKWYNGAGLPVDGVAGDQIPLGSRLLHILDDLVALESEGKPRSMALRMMALQTGCYDPVLLDTVQQHLA